MGIPNITDVEIITIHPQNHKSEYLQSLKLNLLEIYAIISSNTPIAVKNTKQETNGYIELNPLIGNKIGI